QQLTVNSLADTNDGVCDAANCTLREAIVVADPGAEIRFAPSLSGTIVTDGYDINRDLTISGPGTNVLTLDGHHEQRIFFVSFHATFQLSSVRITNASAPGLSIGGAIRFDDGTTGRITDCIIENSGSSGSDSGAIANAGTLTITNTIIRNNSAAGLGG